MNEAGVSKDVLGSPRATTHSLSDRRDEEDDSAAKRRYEAGQIIIRTEHRDEKGVLRRRASDHDSPYE
jgi:hypothetical protein